MKAWSRSVRQRVLRRSKARKLSLHGFTIIEVMIVAVIIGILVAIAVPQVTRARINANEKAAQAALRTIGTACESFRAIQTTPSYPPSGLSDLVSPTSNPSFIDVTLANAISAASARQGYFYTYTPPTAASPNTYSCLATPASVNVTGVNNYFVDETAVIRRGTDATGTPVE